jgi:hypothetical protein
MQSGNALASQIRAIIRGALLVENQLAPEVRAFRVPMIALPIELERAILTFIPRARSESNSNLEDGKR